MKELLFILIGFALGSGVMLLSLCLFLTFFTKQDLEREEEEV